MFLLYSCDVLLLFSWPNTLGRQTFEPICVLKKYVLIIISPK